MIAPPASSAERNIPLAGTPPAKDEAKRQRALERYDILDTPAETGFDRVTDLAARMFDVPVVMLGFVDGERVWFKSSHGLADDEMRRELSLCGQVVDAGGGCESADALHDPLWARHPLVTGAFGLRAFLAMPLTAPDGSVLGSLCVVDRRARAWTAADRASLGDLAGIVMAELEMRRQARSRWRAEIEASAARYRELFEASPQPMWVYDLENLRFLAVNEAAVRLYGYSREEFLGGMTLVDIRPAEDVPDLLEQVRLPPDAEGRLLWRHFCKDGTPMDVEITSSGLTTYEGRPARLVMPYNVSERTAAQEALGERDRYLAALVDVQRELLRHPTVRPALDRVLALLGEASGASRVYFFTLQPDPAGGAPLLHEETFWRAPGVPLPGDLNAERVRVSDLTPAWTEALTRGEAVQAVASRLDGVERGLLDLCGARAILLAPLLVHGRLHGSLGFAQTDVERLWEPMATSHLLLAASTLALALEREEGALALAAETRRLAVTLAALTEGVITTDANGRVVLLNRAAEILTGRPAAESIGRPLREVFRTFEASEGGTLRAGRLAHGSAPERFPLAEGSHRVWLEGADNRRRLIDKVSIPVLDAGGCPTGVVRVFRDVTDEERLAAEMLKASKLDSLGILAGGIAHDFNNILTAILGNVSLARRDCVGTPADEKLDQAERACVRARDLTGQLLTFARGGAPLKKLARLPEIIRESVGFALHGSSARVRFDVPTDLWPVEADTGQLSQVLNNLAINGIQAMGRDGGTLAVRAENLVLAVDDPPGLPGGRYVKIVVEDDGCGIPAGELERIFDPFYTTKPGGSGLGLATSYSIAKRHGGHLNVDSVPGVGSVFRLFLPAAGEEMRNAECGGQNGETLETSLFPASGTPHFPLRVLVLDDEPAVQTLLVDMLGHLGAETVVAETGAGVVAAWRRARAEGQPFNLLILDLTVPGGMGGLEVLGVLRAEDPEVRAIVSSGYAHDPIISRYAEHGFAGVLSKPYRLGDLTAALEAVRR